MSFPAKEREPLTDVIVIGAGAAGMMAALTAAERGCSVLLLERNQKVGRKLYITGKGRCNVTNDCPAAEVLQNVPRNSKFLTSAVTRFPPEEVKAFFEGLGVPLKTERGNRVFPCSDKAADIIDALFMALRRARVELVEDRAEALLTDGEGRVTGVRCEHGSYAGRAVILATGGASYPLTGSTGDGYAMAAALEHTILPPRGSLVPLVAEGDLCRRMQGLSLRNVAVKVRNQKKKVVYYLSMEFLTGKFLGANLTALGKYEIYRDALAELGIHLSDLEDAEREPGLGNGGLGRLAACFLDSLATLSLPAVGCGIRYELGLFR